jgi:Tol biopolymer transport system component
MSDAQDHVRLKRYNLISNKAEDIFDVFSEPGQSWKTHPEISPTGKWVSYAVWSGNFYYEGAEYQDLEILPIEGGNPQRLTTRGGTLTIGGAWSPKDDLIAFTDLDEVGVSQLFLNEITKGHIEQVTNFPDPDSKIEAISWSPIGDQLVFDRSLELREDNSSELWVMDLPTRKISRIDFQFDIFGIGQIFWNNSGNAIVASLSVPGEKDGMYWIDMDKKVVSHALMSGLFKEIDVFGYSFTHPFPISRDLRYLGFLTFDSAFMYDSHTKTIYRLAEIPELQDGMLLDVTPFTQNLNDCFDG